MSPSSIVLLIVILSFLVVAHEWGHFIMARLFKIRVDDFSIGFGKRILRLGKLGDTEYNIRILPLGGFVKIAGMDPDEEPINNAKDLVLKRGKSDDPDAAEIPLIAENTGEGSAYNGPDGFNSKPLWQRSLVILGGPVMSFVTGVVILCLLGWVFGIPMGKPINRVTQVEAGGEGHRIGLRAGDYIIAINNEPVTSGAEMIQTIHGSLNKTIVVTIRRGNRIITLAPARPQPLKDQTTGKIVLENDIVNPAGLAGLGVIKGDEIGMIDDTEIDSVDQLRKVLTTDAGRSVKLTVSRNLDDKDLKGVVPKAIATEMPVIDSHPVGILNFTPDFANEHMGFVASVKKGWNLTISLFKQIGELIKDHQLQKSTGGIVAMANMTQIAQQDGVSHVFLFAAEISINLAIFNILPIPILDGGHLLSFFIEWLRRGRRMTPQMQQAFMLFGLFVIAVLFILITGKDILNQIRGNVPQ